MKIKPNVDEFVKICSQGVGRQACANFYEDIVNECEERGLGSPIEHILYCALSCSRVINLLEDGDVLTVNDSDYHIGLYVHPQYRVGKDRADFLVSHGAIRGAKGDKYIYNQVLVECDSQKFHDRSEKERRKEKTRDRFFISKGYTVFHFTGKEIISEPFRIANEIIAYVTKTPVDRLLVMDEV